MYYIRVVLRKTSSKSSRRTLILARCLASGSYVWQLRLNAHGGDASEEGLTGSAIPRSKGRRHEDRPGQGQTDGEGHGAVSSGRRPIGAAIVLLVTV